MSKGLILFTKNPKLGRVKTRLAKDIGDQNALAVYNQLIRYTRMITQTGQWNNYLFYDREITLHDDWPSDRYRKNLQHNGDLGDRMNQAIDQVLESERYAIIIGSDCGVLNNESITEAFAALNRNDIVIGPTEDGGYYLLGMKCRHPYLFERIAWSTENVFSETIEIIKRKNLSCCTLEKLYDIDYLADWERLLQDQSSFFSPPN